MTLTDLEADKLRHLAIGRDVLVIAEESRVPLVMVETSLSVLAVGMWGSQTGLQLAVRQIRDVDRDGKVGFVVARFETVLPLLDLRYFDLIVYAGEATAEAAGEALDLIRLGCRPDCWVALLDDGGGVGHQVAAFAARTGRRLQCVDRLSVLSPAGRPAVAAAA